MQRWNGIAVLPLYALLTACSSTSASPDTGFDGKVSSDAALPKGDGALGDGAAGARCQFTQPDPYAQVPYVAIHANRENNGRVYCAGPTAVKSSFSTLAGKMIFQPITVSADGKALLATAFRTEGCILYSVDIKTGKENWCKSALDSTHSLTLGAAAGTPISDKEGYIYLTDGQADRSQVYSLHPKDGSLRWAKDIPRPYTGPDPAPYNAPAGLNFTPMGDLVTVTPDGVVLVLNRQTGELLTQFDIRDKTGFVPPTKVEIPAALMPKYISQRTQAITGPLTDEQLTTMMTASMGNSGAYSDNTVAVTGKNQVFVVGGGKTAEEGALVALDLAKDGADKPQLTFHWAAPIQAGSATSPAFSKDGTRAAFGDGAAQIVYLDVEACNQNTDADKDVAVCQPRWAYKLLGRSIMGSMGIDENGVVYAWDSSPKPEDPDAFALRDKDGKPEVVWQLSFASSQDVAAGIDTLWNSSITVMDNVVLGSVSRGEGAISSGIPIYKNLTHYAVAIDRSTGKLVWKEPISDDCMNSPAIGLDGSVFLPLLGMLEIASAAPPAEYQYTGGIIRFEPTSF